MSKKVAVVVVCLVNPSESKEGVFWCFVLWCFCFVFFVLVFLFWCLLFVLCRFSLSLPKVFISTFLALVFWCLFFLLLFVFCFALFSSFFFGV